METPVMFALKTPVFAVVVPDGAQEAVRVHGRVIGRTWEQTPRYDVMSDNGKMFRNLRASVIEREVAEPANTEHVDMPRAA
jgi:hypothetical protein